MFFDARVKTFWAKQSQAASFGEDAGYPAMFFFPASRVLPRSAVSVALVAVGEGGCVEHSLTNTAELNMSSFLTEINIFASINIDYTNQIHYFQLSIYSI